jgi:hypothetical protein
LPHWHVGIEGYSRRGRGSDREYTYARSVREDIEKYKRRTVCEK